MKKITLLRHAKSDQYVDRDDHDRPLNPRGKEACKSVGKYLKENNLIPDIAICSTAIRTQETIQRSLKAAKSDVIVHYSRKLYLATPGEMMLEIQDIDDQYNHLLVAAHNPGTQQLALLLAQNHDDEKYQEVRHKYPTAAISHFTLNIDSWKDIVPGCGNLELFVRPKDI